jgi:transglutaminase-like putative cysteine protease
VNARILFLRTATALVLLAIAAFAASQRDAWILVIGGSAALAAALFTEGPRGRSLPPWVVRIGVLAAMAWGAYGFSERPSADEAPRIVGGVVLGVLLLKMWDRKSPADWRQVMALSIVLVVAAALASAEFVVGTLVVAYAAVTVVATMLYQLHAGEERAAAERRAAAGAQVPGAVTAGSSRGGAAARHLRRLAVAGVLLGAALSSLVFLAFPRDAAQGVGSVSGRVSGFRPDVSLLGSGRTSLSSRVAMTVQLLDPRGTPGELARPLRLRGAVLARYLPESAQWRGGSVRRAGRTYGTDGGAGYAWFAPEAAGERSNVWTQVFEMRALASEHLFSAWLPLGISSDDPRSFLLDPRTAELQDASSGIGGRPRGYRVRMQAYPSPRVTRAVAGALPPRDVSFPVPEVRAIAERIVAAGAQAEIPTPEQAAADPEQRWTRNRRLATLFRDHLSGDGFRYTTDLAGFRRASGEDPIVLFLDRYRFGHCELFASALAALCLSMGTEARLVTGYMTTEYDTVAERYMVRESGAHAWVEVRTGEWQWSTFDPSPMEELLEIQRANRTWMDSFRWALDPVEFAWNSRFASFDGRTQAELGERVATGARGAGEWFGTQASELVQRASQWSRLGPAGAAWLASIGLAVAVSTAAAMVLGRRARRVARELGAGPEGLAARIALGRDAGFYLDALDALASAGLGKPAWRTPMVHAEAIRAARPLAGDAFAAVVARLYAIRFAGRRPSRAERAADGALVRRLRDALAHG